MKKKKKGNGKHSTLLGWIVYTLPKPESVYRRNILQSLLAYIERILYFATHSTKELLNEAVFLQINQHDIAQKGAKVY